MILLPFDRAPEKLHEIITRTLTNARCPDLRLLALIGIASVSIRSGEEGKLFVAIRADIYWLVRHPYLRARKD